MVNDSNILSSEAPSCWRRCWRFSNAGDLKLHALLTHPVEDSGRALYESSVQTLRDMGGTLLVMSGERSEGPLLPSLYAEQMVSSRA